MRTFVAAILCAFASAQQSGRETAAGKVLGRDGSPLAGAEVTFLHRPIPASLDVGPEDRVVATTDARGAFRVRLLPDTRYSAWARWQDGAAPIAEGVMAGDFLTFAADAWAKARSIAITGTEAWAGRGPLAYRVILGSENIDFVTLPSHDGVIDLPALPPSDFRVVEVCDRNGEVLWAGDLVADESAAFAIPAPTELRVVVRDAGTAAPIAGAQLFGHIRNYWYTTSASVFFGDRFRCLWPEVAVTDADGRASVRVALPPDAPDLFLFAVAPGHRGAMGGRYDGGRLFRNGKEVAEAGEEIEFLLPAAAPVAGRVLLPGGPLVDGVVLPTWRLQVQGSNGGGLGLPFVPGPSPIRDGRFTQPAMPDGSCMEQAWTLLPEELRRQLSERFGCTLPRAYSLPKPAASMEQGDALQLDPERLRAVEVVNSRGQPAGRCVMLVSPVEIEGRAPNPQNGTWLRSDRRGRALFELRSGSASLVAMAEDGWASVQVDAASPPRTRLQLQPLAQVQGTVVDGNHEPVPFATVGVTVQGIQGRELPVDAQEIAFVVATTGPIHADAQGRFRLSYLPIALEYTLRPYAYAAGDHAQGRAATFVGDEPQAATGLELVVEPRR